jgi:hexokinase
VVKQVKLAEILRVLLMTGPELVAVDYQVFLQTHHLPSLLNLMPLPLPVVVVVLAKMAVPQSKEVQVADSLVKQVLMVFLPMLPLLVKEVRSLLEVLVAKAARQVLPYVVAMLLKVGAKPAAVAVAATLAVAVVVLTFVQNQREAVALATLTHWHFLETHL